ncbi:MAG: hypothetical protein ACXWKM_10585 [Phenylobacterium sp.]
MEIDQLKEMSTTLAGIERRLSHALRAGPPDRSLSELLEALETAQAAIARACAERRTNGNVVRFAR